MPNSRSSSSAGLRLQPPDQDLVERRVLLDEAGIDAALRAMATALRERTGQAVVYLVGIRTGGAYLAERLALLLAEMGAGKIVVGAVDITLYRDDVFSGLPRPEVGATELPEEVEGRTVVLVDDVLYTGRTVRAALDVLADYGRPRAVWLAVLVDRGRRELPIHPDFVGLQVETTEQESVRVMLRERGEPDRVLLRARAGEATTT